MAKKKSITNARNQMANFTNGFTGSSVERIRVESGVKLTLIADQHAILKFLNRKDIADKCGLDPDAGEHAYYCMFSDGKVTVSIPQNYALSEVDFKPGTYYYLHNAGEIEIPGRNAMQDVTVTKLGIEGEEIGCPEMCNPSGKMKLTLDSIENANYGTMYYPLNEKKNFGQKGNGPAID